MAATDGDSLSEGLGKERKRSSRVVILAVIIVAILIVGAVAWLAVQSGNDKEQHPSEYTKHSPISIKGNGGFTNASGVVGGSGMASDPYIIADWDISASTADGIWIQDTNAHFIVRDCRVHDGSPSYHGISLSNCVNGTLEDNSCLNDYRGIVLDLSSNNTLSNNTCSLNQYGIYLVSSSNNTLNNNNCSNNFDSIGLLSSSNNTLNNNNCSSDSYDGIVLLSSSNNTLSDNSVSSNDNGGITLYSSSNNTLSDNNCSSNEYWGIGLGSFSINNEISWNQVSNNGGWGVDISSGSNNRVWYNAIIGNNGATGTYNASHAQARDDGTSNLWNGTDAYGNHGNYWSDWTMPDAVPPQGIVDHPYIISGSAVAKDYCPLSYNPRIIGISFIPSCLS